MAKDGAITVFTDGSFSSGSSGAGIVLCHRGHVSVRSMPLEGIDRSHEAEAFAAAEGLEDALSVARPGDEITLRLDFDGVAAYVRDGALGARLHVASEWLGPIIKEARGAGVTVTAVAMRGHGGGIEDYSTREAFLNGVADRLANIGRRGEVLERGFIDGDLICQDLVSFDPRFDPVKNHLWRLTSSKEEAASRIGVTPDVIDKLVRFGHLAVIPEVSRITKVSINAVAEEFFRLRHDTEPSLDSPAPGF